MYIRQVGAILLLFALVYSSGCATNEVKQLSEKQIENFCQKKKLEASKPMTNLSLATGSEGPKYEIGITMSSDYIAGRKPEEVYKECKLSFG